MAYCNNGLMRAQTTKRAIKFFAVESPIYMTSFNSALSAGLSVGASLTAGKLKMCMHVSIDHIVSCFKKPA
jgi:hypothetical protein